MPHQWACPDTHGRPAAFKQRPWPSLYLHVLNGNKMFKAFVCYLL